MNCMNYVCLISANSHFPGKPMIQAHSDFAPRINQQLITCELHFKCVTLGLRNPYYKMANRKRKVKLLTFLLRNSYLYDKENRKHTCSHKTTMGEINFQSLRCNLFFINFRHFDARLIIIFRIQNALIYLTTHCRLIYSRQVSNMYIQFNKQSIVKKEKKTSHIRHMHMKYTFYWFFPDKSKLHWWYWYDVILWKGFMASSRHCDYCHNSCYELWFQYSCKSPCHFNLVYKYNIWSFHVCVPHVLMLPG